MAERPVAAPNETINLKFEKIPGGRGGYNRWTINGKSWPDTNPLFTVQQGRRYRLVMNNNSGDEHPVHMHRHSFEVTKVGDKPTSGVMKDTISMPRYTTAEIDFVADDPGATFFHCHHRDHGRGLRGADHLRVSAKPARRAAMSESYPRDMIGYGAEPPHARWPGEARLALQFVINYEEGAENAIFHGDPAAESFLSEWVGAQPTLGLRNMNMESLYEYGSRAGFWRLHRAFTARRVPVTVYGVAMALERNPPAVAAMLAADWEIATHGYRWIDYSTSRKRRARHIAQAIEVTGLTGERPLGWYQGRTSPNTARLIAQEGGFVYDADSYADDLPYWDTSCGKPQLIVPYAFDSNDMRFATPQGFNSGDQFFTYLKDSFDVLYREGATYPRMMSVGLHCRLAGRPGRTAALERFLDYAIGHERVWITRRIDIARHWIATHPFAG